jgi:hypothetical protein
VSSQVITLRFPHETELRFGEGAAPKVGDTLKRGDDEWRVVAVESDKTGTVVVTLARPGDEHSGPAGI